MTKGRILIVEDDLNYVNALQNYLSSDGWDSVAKERGSEALEVLKKEKFDLALVDCWLPGVSGFEVMKTIMKVKPELPVILMSGMWTKATETEALKQGAVSFVHKEKAEEELKAAIEAGLTRKADEALAKPLEKQKGKILLVDDHEGFRHAARRILEKAGFKVEESDSANSTLDIWKKGDFDLAFIDIHLPDVSGIEIAKVLGAVDESMVIAFISGEANREEKIEAQKYSVTSCIDKVYGIERLPIIAESLIKDAREQRQQVLAEENSNMVDKFESGTKRSFICFKHFLKKPETKIVLLGMIFTAIFAIFVLKLISEAELKNLSLDNSNISVSEMYKRIDGYLSRDEKRELERERR